MSAASPDLAPPLLAVDHLSVTFPISSGLLRRQSGGIQAVSDVSFEIAEGETLGLVGESGCGKTTTGRAVLQIVRPTAGRVFFGGADLAALDERALRPHRRKMQLVFQDPFASLNPRMSVGEIVAEPLAVQGIGTRQTRAQTAAELLGVGGLPTTALRRFPHEFSGGQRQRIGIARALAVNPRLILLDEPVSALDVSIQAQVINLLDELQDDLHLSYMFVAHDLSVVRHVSDRIAVMYLGKLMEVSPADELYTKPIHPYTSALLGAIPIPDPRQNRERERPIVGGEPPSPVRPPSGCRFHTRCPRATDICSRVEPQLTEYAGGHLAACHHPQNVSEEEIRAATRSPTSPLSSGEVMPGAEERGESGAAGDDRDLRRT
jgi:oligopeptide/dipeptide ABC transporter ATP-binding protein